MDCTRRGGEHDFKRVDVVGDHASAARLCPFCGLLQVRPGDPPAEWGSPLPLFLGGHRIVELAVLETSLDLSHLQGQGET